MKTSASDKPADEKQEGGGKRASTNASVRALRTVRTIYIDGYPALVMQRLFIYFLLFHRTIIRMTASSFQQSAGEIKMW